MLDDAELEKLIILRMNTTFMEYMRANYNAESRQQFATTVVDDAGAGAGADGE